MTSGSHVLIFYPPYFVFWSVSTVTLARRFPGLLPLSSPLFVPLGWVKIKVDRWGVSSYAVGRASHP